LSAAFPFALGTAFALLALWALQRGARVAFVLLVVLTLAASPVAFVLLAVALAGLALARGHAAPRLVLPCATVATAGVVEILLWRVFPDGGRYPFSLEELLAACVFCCLGAALTWRVPQARALRGVFVVYLATCVIAYAVPSDVGENIARLRFVAIPLAVLVLALRDWRPLALSLAVLALALSWNLTPLLASFKRGRDDPASSAAYWRPAIRFLNARLTPSYRIEAVDTASHWPAVYLARAGIPLARGWFRQDDFPLNRLLYGKLGRRAYLAWLRDLAVRYVVLAHAPPDYSARAEAALLSSGRSGLTAVLRTRNLTIYSVPSPHELVTGAGRAEVLALQQDRVRVRVERPGDYRVAVRYSPYWRADGACVSRGHDGMLQLTARSSGVLELAFVVNASSALDALSGQVPRRCRFARRE
jgi:hypothetical protein